jgi:hypothetical protein
MHAYRLVRIVPISLKKFRVRFMSTALLCQAVMVSVAGSILPRRGRRGSVGISTA